MNSHQENVIKRCQRIKQSVPNELKCRLDILSSYIDIAMSLQSDLDLHDPTNDNKADLEDIPVTTKSLFLSMINKNRKSARNFFFRARPIVSPFKASKHTRLPKFNGKYSEYKNFMSLFENLVHYNPTLTDIEKFNI